MATQPTLYWHDYETFGIQPSLDRPAQFAGIRTDLALNVIDDPLLIYCKPTDDYLPSPQACLINGITPDYTCRHGLNEAEFIHRIHRELTRDNTCTVGYNNIRFDDEFTRYALYRNFFDPYAREWKNGNSRWDILDVVRFTRALRPEGIVWPSDADGGISNRLEHLTRVNGLKHDAAHDALSDVRATIAMAHLIRDRQPRLYNYLFDNRGKRALAALLNLRDRNMLVHTSGMFSNRCLNTSLVLPLAAHPQNSNGIIVYDLRYDPASLLRLDEGDIHRAVFTAGADLPAGVERVPLKTVHVNKCPVVVPHQVLDRAAAKRIDIDLDRCRDYRARILKQIETIAAKVVAAFSQHRYEPLSNPDRMLYSGGFFSDSDRCKMDILRASNPVKLAAIELVFEDGRIPEMLFRYRARNYPDTLNAGERVRWQRFCRERFYGDGQGQHGSYRQFVDELEQCRAASPEARDLLDKLAHYAEAIRPPTQQPFDL